MTHRVFPRCSTSGLLSLVVLVCLAACGDDLSPADQVRARIGELEVAGEAGDRGAFMDAVAEGFQAQGGAMTREDFSRYLLLQMSERRRVQAQLFPVTIELNGPNHAEARFKALLTGGEGLIPDEGRVLDIETEWVLENGEWLLWRARWRAAGP